jgi:DNA polymerase-3 subunit gamma/tau
MEIDGASHRKVEEIRPIIDNVRYAPSRSPYKIYIIDEVHMLSNHAFNSLLKTLEEPPAHVKFIFATTEPLKVPETIRSRCQRFNFRLLTPGDIQKRLAYVAEEEGVLPQKGLLARIARAARGSMRDSISLFDQVISLAGKEPSVEHLEQILGLTPVSAVRELMHAVAIADMKEMLIRIDEVVESGRDPATFVGEVVDFLRDALVMRVSASTELLSYASPEDVSEIAKTYSEDDLMLMIAQLQNVKWRLRRETEQRAVLEMAFLRIARSEQLRGIGELAAGLEQIRDILTGNPGLSIVAPTPATAPVNSSPQKLSKQKVMETPSATIPVADFSRKWDEVVEAVNRASKSRWVIAYFPTAKLSRVADSAVTLHFPPSAISDVKGTFDEIELKKRVEEALRTVSGEDVSVTLVADETLRPHPLTQNDKQGVNLSDENVGETVRLIREVFPGAIVEGL